MTLPNLSPRSIEAHQQVERQLGRCLMLIQQYEHIAKALAAHADLAGPTKQLARIQTKRVKAASTASLGNLVQGKDTVFTNLRTLFTAGEPVSDAPDEREQPAGQIVFAARFRIQLSPEDYKAVVSELDAFVALRNRLVHHFMDKFDIFSDAGCAIALQHLQKSYVEIDRQFYKLLEHANHFDETRQRLAALMQTPDFVAMLTGESNELPDGSTSGS